MAKKISQLTQATEVKSDDVTVIVQDGETKKLPLNMMVTKQDIENKKVAGLAKLDEIEATYENDTYTPTITVKNKSSVKTGEGDEVDYSANVMDGHVKSAILSGQTLDSLVDFKDSFSVNNNVIDFDFLFKNKIDLTYTLVINITEATSRLGASDYIEVRGIREDNTVVNIKRLTQEFAVGTYSIDFTFNEVFSRLRLAVSFNCVANAKLKGELYSVKLPVLTTTGKNLFDGSYEQDKFINQYGTISDSPDWCATDFIRVRPNTTYTQNKNVTSSIVYFCFYNEDKQLIGASQYIDYNRTFTTPNNCHFIRTNWKYSIDGFDFQFEEGTKTTTYEPYKSNILSTPEDLELRAIGDVKDTLNLMTGEVVQNIYEFTLDGSQNIDNDGDLLYYNLPLGVHNNRSNSDKLPSITVGQILDGLIGIAPQNRGNSSRFYIKVNGITTKEEMKNFFLNNPTTIQCILETPTIKTVDLMPSGTHPSTTPYCWKNGHIQLSSSGLLPNLEYSVVTSRAGQINQNATMIVKNDKRIFDLEILLAGGLVNTTYQALTLQNQVETGLSKVSLSSEKEPDYLLYHMIMKLIEEKAYKLDDLAEKVSVFYLYEKLSDTQFETIYSALYPFVEDEIVEEPVVEELPEMVEDEVIM